MSHFSEMESKALVKNEQDLIAALKAVFGEDNVEVHEEAQALTGYDSKAKRKAHIIVRRDNVGKSNGRGSAYNDFGYFRNPDGTYTFQVDPVDVPEEIQNKIAQDYATRVATRSLKAKGYSVSMTNTKGKITLTARPLGKF